MRGELVPLFVAIPSVVVGAITFGVHKLSTLNDRKEAIVTKTAGMPWGASDDMKHRAYLRPHGSKPRISEKPAGWPWIHKETNVEG